MRQTELALFLPHPQRQNILFVISFIDHSSITRNPFSPLIIVVSPHLCPID